MVPSGAATATPLLFTLTDSLDGMAWLPHCPIPVPLVPPPLHRTHIKSPSQGAPYFAASFLFRLSEAGAKMYGAFWCSHCYDQKMDFGREAMAEFPYVECFPQGWKKVGAAGSWVVPHPLWTTAALCYILKRGHAVS